VKHAWAIIRFIRAPRLALEKRTEKLDEARLAVSYIVSRDYTKF